MSETIRNGGLSRASVVLPELPESVVKVLVLALVFPGKMMPFPHVGLTLGAAVLACAAFEAVVIARRVGLRRSLLSQKAAQVDEVLLRH